MTPQHTDSHSQSPAVASESATTRRKTLLAVGGGLCSLPLAGCVSQITGPDPVVTDSTADQDFLDILGGTTEFRVNVHNKGGEGRVKVTVTIYDAEDTTLNRGSKEVLMKADERFRVDIQLDVPEGADRYNATAEAV